MVKKFERWLPHLREPPSLVPSNFVISYLFFIFANPENFMCLALVVVKNFELRQSRLRGTPYFGTPKLIRFSLIFTYRKHFMWPA